MRAAFAAMLDQHLRAGTRPGLPKGQGEPWRNGEFAEAIGTRQRSDSRRRGLPGVADTTVSSWRRGKALPGEIEPILRALFGPLRSDGGEARQALRTAFLAAQEAKDKRDLLEDQSPAGLVFVPQGKGLAINRTPAPGDAAVADDPQVQAEHEAVREEARAFVALVRRRGNNPLSPGWDDLLPTAERLHEAMACETGRLPERLVAAYQACLSLASFFDLDEDYRARAEEGETPLPADMRRRLGDLVTFAAELLHRFPYVQDRDRRLHRSRRPYMLDASRKLMRAVQERGILPSDDASVVSEAVAVTARTGEQAGKAADQLVESTANLIRAGAAARYRPDGDVECARAERIDSLFDATRPELEVLMRRLSPTIRATLRRALDRDEEGADSQQQVFPPLTPLARWREPVPGLPEAAWPDMVTLPAGVFTMGAPEDEGGSRDNERPQRAVTVPRPFALGRVAVTFAQWDAAMDAGFVPPAGAKRPDDGRWGRKGRPVITVSWDDAQAYCAWLNDRLGLRAGTYRLPSEAEWEYACRAGTTTPFSFGDTITKEQVNHYDGRGDRMKGRTVPVGSLPANGWGLHEMHGNVLKWCEDLFGNYPDHATASRPLTPSDSSLRVLRGGSWNNNPSNCRSAYRNRNEPENRNNNVGFRLASTPHAGVPGSTDLGRAPGPSRAVHDEQAGASPRVHPGDGARPARRTGASSSCRTHGPGRRRRPPQGVNPRWPRTLPAAPAPRSRPCMSSSAGPSPPSPNSRVTRNSCSATASRRSASMRWNG